MPPPSSVSYPVKFRKFQQDHSNILIGRPAERTGPPIVLYNKVFGEFKDNFQNRRLSLADDVRKETMGLMYKAQDLYRSETERAKAMNESFQDILGHLDNINNADGTEVDSLLQSEADGLKQGAAMAMIEYKNEIGTGSNDPTIQGGFVYARYWSQSEV